MRVFTVQALFKGSLVNKAMVQTGSSLPKLAHAIYRDF